MSQNNLDNNLNTVSSLEAPRGTLLFGLWYEQVLFDKKLVAAAAPVPRSRRL